ncbi:MAG: hypothetical protein COB14_02590 [Alphaproteobacteria bacterium]|nr:MAG: hypothetical protein COB14_02590 [Alphaproteobacteria bacterium]
MIDGALSRYLHMDESDRATLIDDIELTGGFRQFGYGSLIGDPSFENDKEYGGVANRGWNRWASRRYSGNKC